VASDEGQVIHVRNQVIVGPLVGAAIGFVATWLVLSLAIRILADESFPERSAFVVLIVGSSAIALRVAARARRNRTTE
jgi:hypothetical protein